MGNEPTKILWDKFYETALLDAQKTAVEVLHKSWDGRIQGEDAVNQLIIKKQQQFAQKNNYILLQIWQAYDVNNDGRLQRDELQVITLGSLQALRTWMPKMCREIILNSLDGMRGYFTAEQLREIAKLYRAKLPIIEKWVKNWVDDQIRDFRVLSDKMFDIMDDDKSGKINKAEFLNRYSEACIEVLDPMSMLEKMEKRLYATGDEERKFAEEEKQAEIARKQLKKRLKRKKKMGLADDEEEEEEDKTALDPADQPKLQRFTSLFTKKKPDDGSREGSGTPSVSLSVAKKLGKDEDSGTPSVSLSHGKDPTKSKPSMTQRFKSLFTLKAPDSASQSEHSVSRSERSISELHQSDKQRGKGAGGKGGGDSAEATDNEEDQAAGRGAGSRAGANDPAGRLQQMRGRTLSRADLGEWSVSSVSEQPSQQDEPDDHQQAQQEEEDDSARRSNEEEPVHHNQRRR